MNKKEKKEEIENKQNSIGTVMGVIIVIGVFVFIIFPMLIQTNGVGQKAEIFCQENGMEYYAFNPGFEYGGTDGIWCQTIKENKVVRRMAIWIDGELYFKEEK